MNLGFLTEINHVWRIPYVPKICTEQNIFRLKYTLVIAFLILHLCTYFCLLCIHDSRSVKKKDILLCCFPKFLPFFGVKLFLISIKGLKIDGVICCTDCKALWGESGLLMYLKGSNFKLALDEKCDTTLVSVHQVWSWRQLA